VQQVYNVRMEVPRKNKRKIISRFSKWSEQYLTGWERSMGWKRSIVRLHLINVTYIELSIYRLWVSNLFLLSTKTHTRVQMCDAHGRKW